MVARVYTGREPTWFLTGNVGRAEPGGIVDIPAEHLEAYDRRPDIAVPPSDGEGGQELPGLPGGNQGAPDSSDADAAEAEGAAGRRRRTRAAKAGPEVEIADAEREPAGIEDR